MRSTLVTSDKENRDDWYDGSEPHVFLQRTSDSIVSRYHCCWFVPNGDIGRFSSRVPKNGADRQFLFLSVFRADAVAVVLFFPDSPVPHGAFNTPVSGSWQRLVSEHFAQFWFFDNSSGWAGIWRRRTWVVFELASSRQRPGVRRRTALCGGSPVPNLIASPDDRLFARSKRRSARPHSRTRPRRSHSFSSPGGPIDGNAPSTGTVKEPPARRLGSHRHAWPFPHPQVPVRSRF